MQYLGAFNVYLVAILYLKQELCSLPLHKAKLILGADGSPTGLPVSDPVRGIHKQHLKALWEWMVKSYDL